MNWKFAWAAAALIAGPVAGEAFGQAATATPAAAAAPADRTSRAAGVAAVVNDEIVSSYDVRQRAALLLAGSGIEASEDAMRRAEMQALRDLVDERVQMQEARDRKITVDAAEIDRSLAEIARQNGTGPDQLRIQLAGAGVNIQTLRAQIEADIAWRRLVGGRYGSRIRISRQQVDSALARITANAQKPQALVSEILIAAETEAEYQQAEAFAARLLEEMRNGAPFPAVARQFSSAASAAAGGDLGWLAQGELRPELQSIIDRIGPNQMSTPARATGGVYILAVRDKRAGLDPNAVTRVSLRQVTAPKEARAQLDRIMRRVTSCDGLEPAVAPINDGQVIEMGETTLSELSEESRTRIARVAEGRASEIYESGDRLASMVVCARQSSGTGIPTRDEVENRLFDQELGMLSQRYLRNLRRESTIITR